MKEPTIRELRVRALRVPLPEPHRTASGVVAESPLVLTDVHCSDGSVGHSMVFAYTATALKPLADLVTGFGGWIAGDAAHPLTVEAKLQQRLRLLGAQGLTGMALAAIDMALWDAAARRVGLSLASLLGAGPVSIPVYGAVGYDGMQGSAATAERWARAGFTGVKAKIGYATVDEDIAVIRAMRSAVGPAVAIMVDYNQCLSPVEAIARVRRLDDEGLEWIEEPTLAHDYTGLAQVAATARTPIQAGENWWGLLDLRHAIEAQACDLVMPDVMKTGGVSGWLRASALSQAQGLRVSNHLWPEVSAQLLAATPTRHWLEYADWWNPIVAEPLRIEGGLARLEGVIGSGVTWNEAAVARYAA
jgi:mandelate racemase